MYRKEEYPIVTWLGVIKQPECGVTNWLRTTIFHTIYNDVGALIIVNSGSCINGVSPNIVKCRRITFVPHDKPYNFSWVDTIVV